MPLGSHGCRLSEQCLQTLLDSYPFAASQDEKAHYVATNLKLERATNGDRKFFVASVMPGSCNQLLIA